MYYSLKSDIYSDYGIVRDPELPDGVSFLQGARITQQLEVPLKFVTNCSTANPPQQFLERTIPVASQALLKALEDAGIDSLQAFPALLTDQDGTQEWYDYFAINVLGLVAAADLGASQHVKVSERPGGLPFVGFQRLVIDRAKAGGLYVFRLAESPIELIVNGNIVDYLKASQPQGGWGITVIEREEN